VTIVARKRELRVSLHPRGLEMNYTYLRFGDHLPTVGVLQKLLNRAGANLVVDGMFRDKTRAAVVKFQAARCRRRDGLVGLETWERLTEGLELPIVDCIDIYDSVEKSDRLKEDALRRKKFQILKKYPGICANRSTLDRVQLAELIEFANELYGVGEETVKKEECHPHRVPAPTFDKTSKQQIIAAITKKITEIEKDTAEWADSYANEADDIRKTGGHPILIGGMSNGRAQAVANIVATARGRKTFLLRFHAHGGSGSFNIGKGRAGDVEWNRISPRTYYNVRLDSTFSPLKNLFACYGSVELMSCSFMKGSEGPPMLQSMADIIGVPVSAAVQTQEGGGTATFRFEGPTRTAFPKAGGLKAWCSSLPDLPKGNTKFVF
jgi:hypothetical protein